MAEEEDEQAQTQQVAKKDKIPEEKVSALTPMYYSG